MKTTYPSKTEVLVAGTIKKHTEYRGAKETILSRCEVEEIRFETDMAA